MVPSAFLRLDAFALTPNGKIDRRALLAPDSDAFVLQNYEAPQGDFEAALAALWAELLGVRRIGRHDDFFALGGHSLLALQMTQRCRATLGVTIPVHELFSRPSIAALSKAVLAPSAAPHESFPVLVPIRVPTKRAPLFCIHPVSGLSWHYRNLASHLPPEQPVYGIQARGFDDPSLLATSIDAMALDYIQQMRRIQPDGPYYLLGWSLGGNIAHSMATQLEQQGERIALLAVLDSMPDHRWRGDSFQPEWDASYIRSLARYDGDPGAADGAADPRRSSRRMPGVPMCWGRSRPMTSRARTTIWTGRAVGGNRPRAAGKARSTARRAVAGARPGGNDLNVGTASRTRCHGMCASGGMPHCTVCTRFSG
jgi:pimeloyl-ACP methyl ester carboxylesterase